MTAFGFLLGLALTFGIGASILAIGLTESSSASAGGADGVALLEGQRTYVARCASCHGANGGGNIGPALGNGVVVENYPDIASQIRVISEGRGVMPAFANVLTPDEIEAVASYEREQLGR
jgi:cytochrome c oxidase subunit 2